MGPRQIDGFFYGLFMDVTLPLVAAATLYRLGWFYPAFMIVLGAHYFPFAFLYGLRLL